MKSLEAKADKDINKSYFIFSRRNLCIFFFQSQFILFKNHASISRLLAKHDKRHWCLVSKNDKRQFLKI